MTPAPSSAPGLRVVWTRDSARFAGVKDGAPRWAHRNLITGVHESPGVVYAGDLRFGCILSFVEREAIVRADDGAILRLSIDTLYAPEAP